MINYGKSRDKRNYCSEKYQIKEIEARILIVLGLGSSDPRESKRNKH